MKHRVRRLAPYGLAICIVLIPLSYGLWTKANAQSLATPTATPTPAPTPSPTPEASATPAASATPIGSATPAASATPAPSAVPTATADPSATPGITPTPTATPGATPADVHIVSGFGRFAVGDAEAAGIESFIVNGNVAKTVLLRVLGPSLQTSGQASGTISDPVLELRDALGSLIFANDNWMESPQAPDIQASGLAPGDNREPAIIAALPPGQFVAIVRSADGSTGIAQAEIYDLDSFADVHLVNVSSRGAVLTGDNVLVSGFALEGDNPKFVLLRALGPELAARGVPDALPDPTLELRDANGGLIATNDNWKDSENAADIQATGAAPIDDRESAILMSLPAGSYAAIVRSADGTIGIALAEVFRLQ